MIRLGVIADDFTGASDIASFLVENGLPTVQMNGVPSGDIPDDIAAVVISLKSRSNPVEEAVAQSLAALRWLQQQDCQQFYFKYCSTFDSTEHGNIGPVTDALMAALGTDFTVITPALPVNGRTIFNGYLFVGNVLLNESGMQNHPITPMRDANLLRLMDAQAQGTTGLVPYATVLAGAEAVKAQFQSLQAAGHRYAVVDAVDNRQLAVLAEAVADMPLVTGGSGLGAYMAARLSGGQTGQHAFVPPRAKTVILSGSCSVMTNKQVAAYQSKAATLAVEVKPCIETPDAYVETLFSWALAHLEDANAPLLYATVPPEKLKAIQAEFGADNASHAVEKVFAQLATKLHEAGVRNFITAGGETSSIIVQQLQVQALRIGKQIAPGVPWLQVLGEETYLALKSGNFGRETFFSDAQEMCE